MKPKYNIFYCTALISALLLYFSGLLDSARAQVNLTNGLWAYYGFNDGTASNNTAGGPAGTLVGGVVVTNGWFQNALYFDGTDATVTFGSVGYFSAVTASAYVMLAAPLANNTEQEIVNQYPDSGREGYALAVVQTNGVAHFIAKFHARHFYYYYDYYETSVLSLTTPVPGQVYYVALTYDGSTLCLYVNGIKEAQKNTDGSYYYAGGWTSPNLSIGSRNNTDSYFDGMIDEVYIYTRALSPAEIQQLAFPPLAPYITQQPTGMIVTLGTNATFNVSATAASALPLSYQWQRNGSNLLTNSNLVSVTSSSLTISNVQMSDLGFYSVLVTNVAGSVNSSSVLLGIADTTDSDGDGIPDWWESTFGLNPNDPSDATNHPVGDKLSYLQKYIYGLNPLTTDTDGDGISDYDELFTYGTNPQNVDTDGDGIPDNWEIQYGLNPLINDANKQAGFVGVTYLQIYQYNLTHTNQLDPRNPFPQPDKSNYEIINNGGHTNRIYYDHEDRVLGEEFSSGISLAYTYDGNGNIVRQTYLSRASETNGLPVLWKYLNGLTNGTVASGPNGDPDGDGFSNCQEWLAGSDPNNSQSKPNQLGPVGNSLATLTLPFTVSNFVAGVGQLDGSGAEEIVVGGDGNPGSTTNSIYIFTESSAGWTTQKVDIGSFGITSLAIGQTATRPAPAIYAGLRQAGGKGRVMELMNVGGVWQTNILVISTNATAFVLGVRSNLDVLVSYFPTNGIDGGLYSVSYTGNSWTSQPFDGNTSHRGLGITATIGTIQSGARLLDTGGIQCGLNTALPMNAIYRASANMYYFPTPYATNWTGAETYAKKFGGNLVTITNVVDNTWLHTNFGGPFWMGLSRPDCNSAWTWISGAPFGYSNWYPGEPNCAGGTEHLGELYADGTWNDASDSSSLTGLVEVAASAVSQIIAEPPATNRLLWRGVSLAVGTPRWTFTNGSSLFYAFVDDIYSNGQINAGDYFVLSESFLNGTNVNQLTLSRQLITATNLAQSYGLASVNFLNSSNEMLFTGEPDGEVFAWTASGATNPLQRQLFSSQHIGKVWHALFSVRTLEPGEGLAGLCVDPTNQNSCALILWPPQAALQTLPQAAVVETAPAAIVVPSSNPLGSNAIVVVRLWDNEGDTSTPFLQYQFLGTTNWQAATLTTLDGSLYNSATRVTASPSGSSHTLVWNAIGDVGANVVTNILLRARAQDFMLAGNWSQPTPFQLDTTMATSLPPPTNSPVSFTGITPIPGGIQFNWQGSTNAFLYLQCSPILAGTNVNWVNIWTGAPPTLYFGSYTDFIGTNPMEFYRMKSVSP